MITFYETSFKTAGPGNSKVSEVKQAGKKTGLSKQGPYSRTWAEKKMYKHWKKGQVTQEADRDDAQHCKDKIHVAKALV